MNPVCGDSPTPASFTGPQDTARGLFQLCGPRAQWDRFLNHFSEVTRTVHPWATPAPKANRKEPTANSALLATDSSHREEGPAPGDDGTARARDKHARLVREMLYSAGPGALG